MTTTPTDPHTAVAHLAAQLHETTPEALRQFGRIVEHLGIKAAYAYLQETLAIEAGGGMLTKDNGRRRTPGGTFFHPVRTRLSPEDRRILFPYHPPSPKEKTAVSQRCPHRTPPPALSATARQQLLQEALQQPGEMKSMKLTIVARPGKVRKVGG